MDVCDCGCDDVDGGGGQGVVEEDLQGPMRRSSCGRVVGIGQTFRRPSEGNESLPGRSSGRCSSVDDPGSRSSEPQIQASKRRCKLTRPPI